MLNPPGLSGEPIIITAMAITVMKTPIYGTKTETTMIEMMVAAAVVSLVTIMIAPKQTSCLMDKLQST